MTEEVERVGRIQCPQSRKSFQREEKPRRSQPARKEKRILQGMELETKLHEMRSDRWAADAQK
jgi:hypothetical protein